MNKFSKEVIEKIHSMRNLNLLSLMLIALISLSCVTQEYKWKEIKEFKFYGGNNPIEKKDSMYVLADVDIVTELLTKSNKSEGCFPKGAQNYATILFNDSRIITIQILPGLPAPIRVINGDLFDDDWFDFDDEIARKWIEYIRSLEEELNK